MKITPFCVGAAKFAWIYNAKNIQDFIQNKTHALSPKTQLDQRLQPAV